MRKNEKAKIKIIKPKHGFGRKEEADKLRFPAGYEDPESENRKRLVSKGIIYEVKLLDWIEREDIDGDKAFIKTWIKKPARQEYERPTEIDEVLFNLRVYQENNVELMKKEQCHVSLDNEEITFVLKKILESMKKEEKSFFEFSLSTIKEKDQALFEKLDGIQNLDKEKSVFIEIELFKIIKVEDWFKDKTTLKKTLRKGKGSQPNDDTNVFSKIWSGVTECSETENSSEWTGGAQQL